MCVLAFFDAGGVSPDSSLTIRLNKRSYRHYATEENRAAGQYPIGDEDIVNVGDYFVRLESGNSNYTFTPIDFAFTIDPKNLNNVNSWTNISEEGFAYTGAPITLDNEMFGLTDNVGVLLNYVGNIESLPNEFLAKAYTDATGDFDNNQLQGTDAGTAVSSITGGAVYVLYNDEFVKSTTGTIPANRAYLVLDDAVYGGGNSRTLTIAINTITGIADVNATTLANGQYYNLQGMRMTQSRKGIVIVNGKKMFVK